MIKCIALINPYGERIKRIDNGNKTAACPVCGEKEYWDHVLLCEQNKIEREEWEKELDRKLKNVENISMRKKKKEL